MNLRTFEEYINVGMIKRITPNKARALSLVAESQKKKQFMELVLSKIEAKQVNQNFIIDSCYDIIIELIRAKMIMEGFSSEKSHEAEISYMKKLKFQEKDIAFMNELRYYRNGIKYYGKIMGEEYANKVLEFMKENYNQIKQQF